MTIPRPCGVQERSRPALVVEVQAATLALTVYEAVRSERLLLERRRFGVENYRLVLDRLRTRLRFRPFQLVGCSLQCRPSHKAGEGEVSRLGRASNSLVLFVREPHRND
jgi:hypothetical protein